jgi:hypothetical protein
MTPSIRAINAPHAVIGHRSRSALSRLLFPHFQARFAIALLLTFFPYAILYPLDYPAGELLTLGCWIWVFPSTIGFLSLLLVPFIPSPTYGYYAFNLFCLVANLSIASSAAQSTELQGAGIAGLHRFARCCMLVTLVTAAAQAITDPYAWMAIFTNMRLEAGRGAGFRLEPSQLSCLLALYLALLAGRIDSVRTLPARLKRQRVLLREGVLIIACTLVVTRSFSVLIVAICFAPVLFIRPKRLLLPIVISVAGGIIGSAVLGSRISDAFATSGGSIGDLITAGVDSWRNVPDILILSNIKDFLLPGNPAEVRIKLHTFAVLMSPLMAWIENTFSVFSAGGVSAGVLATGSAMLAGLVAGSRRLAASFPTQTSWLLLYATAWFFMAKWDPSAWVVLGLLPLMHRINKQRTDSHSAIDEATAKNSPEHRQEECA